MRSCLLLFITIFPFFIKGQDRDIDLESFAERFYQLQDDDLPYEQIYESLLQYYMHPVNLNKTSSEELLSLNILTPEQINHLMDHIRKNGPLISIYELQSIPSFSPEIIRDLLPFVTVRERHDSRNLWERIRAEENNYLLLRHFRTLQSKKGYQSAQNDPYVGDPNYFYARYRVSKTNDFSLGFTLEKDAGEQFFRNDSSSTSLADFQSYHFFLKDKGLLKALALGDYQIQLGQGLVFGSGFSFGKGAEPIHTIRRNEIGLRPYTSALESGFFRGAGLALGNNHWTYIMIYSTLDQDARLINDTTFSDFEEYISSIQETGYHRNQSELARKDQLRETTYGGGLSYQSRYFRLGITSIFNRFSHPIRKKPNNYNQFEFVGTENWTGSIYGSFLWQNINAFGELAQSSSGGIAYYAGLIASLTPQVDFSFSLRNYNKNFHSFYANGFGEQSRTINEKGAYWGLKFTPYRKLILALYFDHFEFPWLRYGIDAPSEGMEYLGRLTYKLSRKIQLYAQYREEVKEVSATESVSNLSALTSGIKRNLIFNADYEVTPSVSMKTRLQTSNYDLGELKSAGFALMQDIQYKIWRLKFDARFAIFDTDNYDNRIYAYERDLLYTFSIPAYAGNGTRTYIMMRYSINRSINLWIKYARFNYQDAQRIGNGSEEISSPVRSDIRTMLKINF